MRASTRGVPNETEPPELRNRGIRKPLVRPVRPSSVQPEAEDVEQEIMTAPAARRVPPPAAARTAPSTRRPASATSRGLAGSYAAQYFPSAHISNIHATLRTLNDVTAGGSTSRVRSSSAHLDVSNSAIHPRANTPSATAVDLLASTQRSLERAQRDLHVAQRQRLEAESSLSELVVEVDHWRAYAEELETELETREVVLADRNVESRVPFPSAPATALDHSIMEAYHRARRVASEDFVDPVPDSPAAMIDFLADRLVDLRASTEQLADADAERVAMANRLTTIAAQWEERERQLEARIAELESDVSRQTTTRANTLPSPTKPLAEQLKMDELFTLLRDVRSEPVLVVQHAARGDTGATAASSMRRSEPEFTRLMNQVEDGIGAIRSQRLRARVENSERQQLRAQLEAVTAEMESLHGQFEARLRDVRLEAEHKLEAANTAHAQELRRLREELKQAADSKGETSAAAQRESAELQHTISSTQSALAAAHQKLSDAQTALDASEVARSALEAELSACRLRLSDVESQRDATDVALDRKCADLQAKVAELQDHSQVVNSRTKELATQLEEALAKSEAAARQIETLRAESEEWRVAAMRAEHQLEFARDEEGRDDEARVRELETMVDELRRLHDQANERIAELEAEAEEATSLLEKLSPGRPVKAGSEEKAHSLVPLDGASKALEDIEATWPAGAELPALSGAIDATAVRSWSFSAVAAADALEDDTECGGVLYQVGMRVAEAIGALSGDETGARRAAFGRFLLAATQMYYERPYHNLEHAADVVQSTGALLLMAPHLLDAMSTEERLATLTAAAGHDVGHPGRNNLFLINTGDALADRYPDRGPLEGFHTAASQELARATGLLKAVGSQSARFRAIISAAILNTDMGKHAHGVEELLKRGQSAAGWDPNDAAQRLELIASVVHAADIANSAKPDRPTVLLWTERVTAEFEAQGKEEMELGLPVSPGCQPGAPLAKGQLFFIDFLCLPLFRALAIALEGSCDGQEPLAKFTSHAIRDIVLASLLKTREYWAEEAVGDGHQVNAVPKPPALALAPAPAAAPPPATTTSEPARKEPAVKSLVPLDGASKALEDIEATWPAGAELPALSGAIDATAVRSWSFSAVAAADALEDDTECGGVLYQVGMRVAEAIGALSGDETGARRAAFGRFLLAATQMYYERPYHNLEHAADVVQSTGALLLMAPHLLDAMSTEERLATLTAAAGHDVGHPGRNNLFLINTGDALADRYPDRGPLEGFHTAASQELARATGLLKAVGSQSARFRAIISAAILNTDMGKHAHGVEELLKRGQSAAGWDPNDAAQRLELIASVVHAADIANSAKPDRPTVLLWTERVTAEFEAQGKEEMELGLPVSPGCQPGAPLAKGQLFFIDFLCLPLFRALAIALEGSCDGVDNASTPPSLGAVDLIPSLHPLRDTVLSSLIATRCHWASQCGDPPLPPPPALPSRARSASTSPPMDVAPPTPSESDIRLWKERERMLLGLVHKYQDMVRVLEQQRHAPQERANTEEFQSPVQRSGTRDRSTGQPSADSHEQPRSGSREASLEALSPVHAQHGALHSSSGSGRGDLSNDMTLQLLNDLTGQSEHSPRHIDPTAALNHSSRYAAVDDSDEDADNVNEAHESTDEEEQADAVPAAPQSSAMYTAVPAVLSPTHLAQPTSRDASPSTGTSKSAGSPHSEASPPQQRSSAEPSPTGVLNQSSGSTSHKSESSPHRHAFDDSEEEENDGEQDLHDVDVDLPGQETPERATVSSVNPFAASPATAPAANGVAAVVNSRAQPQSMIPPSDDDEEQPEEEEEDGDVNAKDHSTHHARTHPSSTAAVPRYTDESSDEGQDAGADYDEDFDEF